MILKRKSVIQVTIYIRYSKIKSKVCSGSVGEWLTWGRWSEPQQMQYVLSLSKTINLVLSTGSTQKTSRHDWKVVDKEKVSTKKNKKALHQKKNLKIRKISKWNYASVRMIKMLCQKGVPQKKRDPTKFDSVSLSLFMRITNGKHTSLPRPPAWGSYWSKNPCYSDEKIKQ